MSGQILYRLPASANDLAEVIMSVPEDWHTVNGSLEASKSIYARGGVVESVLELSKRLYFDSRYTKIEIHLGGQRDSFPSISDILFHEKLPSGVRFDLDGCDKNLFKETKKLIACFIRTGYKGNIRVFSNLTRDYIECKNISYLPETFSFSHGSNEMILTWVDGYGGKKENLDSIIKACKKLGLEELKPEEPGQ